MTSQPAPSSESFQHAVFRPLLQAMSRPGLIQLLPQAAAEEQLANLLDCLFDNEVRFCLAAPDQALVQTIQHRWKARPVDIKEAEFLLAPEGRSHGLLQNLQRGTPDYPDRGATVIYQVASFAAGGATATLTGPGIKARQPISICGLGPAELSNLRKINSEFPLGIDAIFISRSGELLCIPRSTRMGD